MKMNIVFALLVSGASPLLSMTDDILTDIIVIKDRVVAGSEATFLIILPKRSDEYRNWSLYVDQASGPIRSGELRDKPYRETFSLVLSQPGSYQGVIIIDALDGAPRQIRRATLTVLPSWIAAALLQWGGAVIGAVIGVLSALSVLAAQKLYDARSKVDEFRFHLLAYLRQLDEARYSPSIPQWVAEMESTPFLGCSRKFKVINELIELRTTVQSWAENRISPEEAHIKIVAVSERIRMRLGVPKSL